MSIHESEEKHESPVNSVKVLGVSWNAKSDTLHQEHSDLVKYAETLPPTTRSVFKQSAKIFDPIGLIVIKFTIQAKVQFQVLCLSDQIGIVN